MSNFRGRDNQINFCPVGRSIISNKADDNTRKTVVTIFVLLKTVFTRPCSLSPTFFSVPCFEPFIQRPKCICMRIKEDIFHNSFPWDTTKGIFTKQRVHCDVQTSVKSRSPICNFTLVNWQIKFNAILYFFIQATT